MKLFSINDRDFYEVSGGSDFKKVYIANKVIEAEICYLKKIHVSLKPYAEEESNLPLCNCGVRPNLLSYENSWEIKCFSCGNSSNITTDRDALLSMWEEKSREM